MTGGVAPGWSMTGAGGAEGVMSFDPGVVVANRYEIIELLGEGGMGAVYKARDRELDRLIALKVIRPELAGHPTILQRFKQELILARQITHKNVIRIFDLGIFENLKYITMEFVEGQDLSHVMKDRKFSLEESIRITRQIARALEAAHAESVVHRDLKPQNVMLTEGGKVSVMDFGLARSLENTGLTQTGAILGTPAYMSPEQALGRPADARSDLFALGVIFYELLTGAIPFEADTVLASMLRRTQGPPTSPVELNPTIPADVNAVALKCLATEPADRYQTAADLIQDLDTLAGERHMPLSTVTALPPVAPPKRSKARTLLMASAAFLMVALAGVGVEVWKSLSKKTIPQGKPITVLVADFQNTTGDSIFNGTLEPMFTLALEGARFVTATRRDTALQMARQQKLDATSLDEQTARLVALREGIQVVVAGSIRQSNGAFAVSVRALDGTSGKEIAHRETTASDKEGVLKTVGKLAAGVRSALGDATPESKQIAAAETFTAGSLQAAQAYAAGQNARFGGSNDAAVASYRQAIEFDPNFGTAYASLAAVLANIGQREEAKKYFDLAYARIDRMTERERYKARGSYYLAMMDPAKAIDEFSNLAQQFPADAMGPSGLAGAYNLKHDSKKALENGRRALELQPRYVPYRNNVALYAVYAGEFETAEREATAALTQNPAYLKAYVTLGLAQIEQGQLAKARESYDRMRTLNARGASFASTGDADIAMYEGRAEDAITELDKGIADDLKNKNTAGAAKKMVMKASALLMLRKNAEAIQTVDAALKQARESVAFPAALVYAEAGQDSKASDIARELGEKFEPVPQAFAKVIEGELKLRQGRARDAIKIFEDGLSLSDMWMVRFDMGRAYLAAEAYPQADSAFDLCVKRRGEASDIFSDEQQTLRFAAPLYYYIGRAREGLKSPGAADAYKQFLALKSPTAHDAMVEDARKRAAGR